MALICSSSMSLGTSLRIKSPSDSVLGLEVGTLVANLRVLLSRFSEGIFSVLFLFKELQSNSPLFYLWEDVFKRVLASNLLKSLPGNNLLVGTISPSWFSLWFTCLINTI